MDHPFALYPISFRAANDYARAIIHAVFMPLTPSLPLPTSRQMNRGILSKNPTIALMQLLGASCAGLVAIALVAQTPPAARESHATASALLAAESPVASIHAHLCGFHFYSGDLKRAVRVEHYCSHLNEDVLQCVVYDSTAKNARLIGVEYIISEALFKQLPAEEKKLWHSHRYEVMSGLLTAPDASGAAEQELMKDFVSTYGKTWTLWQVDRGDKLPLGLPKLMMGFTAEGQLDTQLVADRDRELKIDSSQVKAKRADLATRPIAEGADAWQQGRTFQISDDLLKQPPAGARP